MKIRRAVPTISAAIDTCARSSQAAYAFGGNGCGLSATASVSSSNTRPREVDRRHEAQRVVGRTVDDRRASVRRRSPRSDRRGRLRARTSSPGRRSAPGTVRAGDGHRAGRLLAGQRAEQRGGEERAGRGDETGLLEEEAQIGRRPERRARCTRRGAPTAFGRPSGRRCARAPATAGTRGRATCGRCRAAVAGRR